ncbi:Major facilitator superfamily transporter [Purpureocillium lavendulum]|uniref:Major facilitator superfamily transporter n=1 Tax=Purpureocillium lavendulum TaxID=1247861 RepID=A0AB34G0K9_9HYPO|nr:Major facilitator superfamily transporter [Purpureocillium lavendulum]
MSELDSEEQMLHNAREVLGCTGLLTVSDLGGMRQSTIERRISAVRHRLSPASIASLYAVWLREQALRERGPPADAVVRQWVNFLASSGCDDQTATRIWTHAALMALGRWRDVMSDQRVRDVRADVRDAIQLHFHHFQLLRSMADGADTLFPAGLFGPGPRPLPAPPHPLQGQLVSGHANPPAMYQDTGEAELRRLVGDFDSDPLNPVEELTTEIPLEQLQVADPNGTCERCFGKGHLTEHCPMFPFKTQVQPNMPTADVQCRICNTKGHLAEHCPGKAFGYAPLPTRRQTGGDSLRPAVADNVFLTRPGSTTELSSIANHGPLAHSPNEGDDDYALKGIEQMNEAELEALRKADEFLARLSGELALEKSMRESEAAATPAPHVPAAMPEPAPKRRKKLNRIPVLGQLVEPAKPKPKPRPLKPKPTEAPAAHMVPPVAVKLGETEKPVAAEPQYSLATQELFQDRGNVWMNKVPRRKALEMWEEDDAERAAAAAAAQGQAAESMYVEMTTEAEAMGTENEEAAV